MAKELKYITDIIQGNIIDSWHVSQSVEAFSAATGVQQDYDISVSGSFKVTGSQFIKPNTLLNQTKNYVLSYDDTTGQIFKMLTSSIEDGDDEQEVYRTGSSDNNIIPNKFGTFDNTGTNSVISSGNNNKINTNCSFIGGGTLNTASNCLSAVVGGSQNSISGNYESGFIGTGLLNCIDLSNQSGIVAGRRNCIGDSSGTHFIGGGVCNTVGGYSDSNLIVGGANNCINNGSQSTSIVGGSGNTISNYTCAKVIVGGRLNSISSTTSAYSFIGGGCRNKVTGTSAVIVGGTLNTASAACSFIGGGENNNILSTHTDSFIVGSNIISHATCTTHVNNLTVSGSAAGTSVVMMRGLPTSDPSNVGQLWNDGGTLKISI